MPHKEPEMVGGRYRILEKLGEGGMGTVYAARDERLQREVAIKRLHGFGGSEAQINNFRQRFQREAVSMAQFIHPYIVPVYDYGDEDGWVYLVMGYMSGGSLKDRMHGSMPVKEAVKLLIPIASALAYVHENGIIHRDVKPQNILFNRRGIPMLADFGILKLMESEGITLTAAGTGIGTPAYMAPEQITADLTPQVDQYSLGVVFYEMVTGKKPFEGDTPVMTLIMHRTDPLPDPHQFVPELSDETCRVLRRALAKKPEHRFENMEAFEAALQALLVEDNEKTAPPFKDIEPMIEEFIEQVEERIEERKAEDGAVSADEALEAETQLAQPNSFMDEEATQINAQMGPSEAPTALMDEEANQISEVEIEQPSPEFAKIEDRPNGDEPTQISTTPPELTTEGAPIIKRKLPLWIPIVGAVVLVTVVVLFATGVFANLFSSPIPTIVPQEPIEYVEEPQIEEPEPEPPVEEEPFEEEWNPERGSLSFKGHWALIPIIERTTEEFRNEHPQWRFTLEAMSSEDGLRQVAENGTDFGLSNRERYSEEMIEFGNLEFFQIAWNPVIVFVNPELDVENLTIEEIYLIFFGELNNWAELGGPDLDIVRVFPNDQNESYWNFHACLRVEEERITDQAIYHEEEQFIIREVAEIPGAIGFSSVFNDFDGVHITRIEEIELSEDAIQEDFWPLQTPMFLITNGEPSPQEWYFLEYIYSERGKEWIIESRFSPVR